MPTGPSLQTPFSLTHCDTGGDYENARHWNRPCTPTFSFVPLRVKYLEQNTLIYISYFFHNFTHLTKNALRKQKISKPKHFAQDFRFTLVLNLEHFAQVFRFAEAQSGTLLQIRVSVYTISQRNSLLKSSDLHYLTPEHFLQEFQFGSF